MPGYRRSNGVEIRLGTSTRRPVLRFAAAIWSRRTLGTSVTAAEAGAGSARAAMRAMKRRLRTPPKGNCSGPRPAGHVAAWGTPRVRGVIHPIPSGTRDVLPEEMRELRAITEAMRGVFDDAGYGEVYTPALEHEATLMTGDAQAAHPAYRFFDASGQTLVLRSDMTIPIARVVATRYADVEPPLRFCYFAHAWRAVDRGVGEPREFMQAGLELIGAAGTDGEAEVVGLTVAALEAAGLRRHRIGVGDASLYRRLLAALDVPEERHLPLLDALAGRDLVGLEL